MAGLPLLRREEQREGHREGSPINTPLVEDAVWVEEEVVEDEVGEDISSEDREEAVSLLGIEGGGVEPCDLPPPVLCQGLPGGGKGAVVAQQRHCLG